MSRDVIVSVKAPTFYWRVSDRPVPITGVTDGSPSFAEARLVDADELQEEIEVAALQRAEFSTARLTLAVPPDFASASVDAAFSHIAYAVVEVATLEPGAPWATRRVWIGYGIVSGLTLDVVNAAIQLVAEASAPATGSVIGDPARDMGNCFPSVVGVPRLTGKALPTIVGAVYRVPGHKVGAYTVGARGLLVAGHHFADTSQVVTIYADGTTYAPAGTITIVNTLDDEGDPVAIVSSDDGSDFADADGSFTVDFPGGGVAGVRGGGNAALGADGVIAWLLANAGVAIDWARVAPALQYLAGYEIGVYLDAAGVDALEVLRERILPLLPLVEESGLNGLWLRVVDPWVLPVAATLHEGANLIGFTGQVTQISDPDSLFNSYSAVYGYDHDSGAYLEYVAIDGDTHALCATSRALLRATTGGTGIRAATELEVDCSWHAATVASMLRSIADRTTLPAYEVGAYLDASLDALSSGDVVEVTAASLGWTSRRCVVSRRSERADPIDVGLVPVAIPVAAAVL